MSTIGHPILALSICILFYYVSNKRFNSMMCFLFVVSSILPDVFCMMFLFIQFMGRIEGNEIQGIRNIPHEILSSVWGWTIGSFMITIMIYNLLNDELQEKVKLTMKQTFLIILSSGFIHMFLDGFTQWIWIIGDFYVCFNSFYTTIGIGGEQDFIVAYFLFFLIIPLFLLYLSLDKDVQKDSRIVRKFKKIIKEIK